MTNNPSLRTITADPLGRGWLEESLALRTEMSPVEAMAWRTKARASVDIGARLSMDCAPLEGVALGIADIANVHRAADVASSAALDGLNMLRLMISMRMSGYQQTLPTAYSIGARNFPPLRILVLEENLEDHNIAGLQSPFCAVALRDSDVRGLLITVFARRKNYVASAK